MHSLHLQANSYTHEHNKIVSREVQKTPLEETLFL